MRLSAYNRTKCIAIPKVNSNTPERPRFIQLVFLSNYWPLTALDTVSRGCWDRVPRHWFQGPNLPETHFKSKVPSQYFPVHVVQQQVASNAVYSQRLPRAAQNINQTLSFRKGSEPHGISSLPRISPNPVLNENGFKELPRALLSAADFVERPLEPEVSYTHVELGFVVK
ncbi:hypothetical protein AAC387_Pa02g2100 [Persea americana]